MTYTQIESAYLHILSNELKKALGCTEPIAIAFAAATAREVLGVMPTSLSVACSGNVIKNAKGVVVPNSGGMKGIIAAAILGAVGGDAQRKLEVLDDVTDEAVEQTHQLLRSGMAKASFAHPAPSLFIEVRAAFEDEWATVTIEDAHSNITRIVKNGETIFEGSRVGTKGGGREHYQLLNVKDILHFASTVEIDSVRSLLDEQIFHNETIASEGLANSWGISVGKTLLQRYDSSDVRIRARAKAAAASDARMSGCALPVVINSGSGNQGLTVSLPVLEYARDLQVSKETMYRALVLANLVAIHQKNHIGNLSAYCGAVCAATGAACGISYLHGGDYEAISRTIIMTLANVGGIICDGAKPSCASKISSALDAAIFGFEMGTVEQRVFSDGEGLVKDDVELTIQNFGHVGKEGMRSTDEEIIRLMLQ